ncbi:MAG: metallophosphoesterase [Clostridia bacterium]
MKTILAFSDSHNSQIPDRLLSVIEETDYVFFLGDGTASLSDLAFHEGFYAVSGNCDAKVFPDEEIVDIDGFKMLLTHGDKYNVKRDLLSLSMRAKELNCNVVFYGHTHFAEIDTIDNITFICPGTIADFNASMASYVLATVSQGKFCANIVNLV